MLLLLQVKKKSLTFTRTNVAEGANVFAPYYTQLANFDSSKSEVLQYENVFILTISKNNVLGTRVPKSES